jgi:methyl-accepting chemotaxis protein
MKMLINKPVLSYFSFALLCVMIIGVVTNSMENLNHTLENNRKSYQTLLVNQRLTTSVIDMETGARGFFINQKAEFLDPYYSGEERFDANIRDLKETGRVPAEDLDQIKKDVEAWKSLNRGLFDIHSNTPPEEYVKIVSGGSLERKALIDRVRRRLEDIENRENIVLEISIQQTQRSKLYTRIATYACTFVAIFLIFFLTKALERAISELNQAVKDLTSERALREELQKKLLQASAPKRRATTRKPKNIPAKP